MKSASTFLLGFFLGAATVVLAKRLRVVLEEEDIDSLTHKLEDQLGKLEHKVAAHVHLSS